MEPSAGYPDSPMDADDAVYPCKGCGEVCPNQVLSQLQLCHAPDSERALLTSMEQILEEGKAFELGRVHDHGRHASR